MRALLHVQYFVNRQRSRLTEPFPAFSAFKWLLLGVDVPVIAQMILTPKSLAANITGVRSFVRMRSFVYQQVVGLGKLTITEFADKFFAGTTGPAGCGCLQRALHNMVVNVAKTCEWSRCKINYF